ncbi:hypothetical protein BLNAU_2285 [Blattamonas nauphoetae]|uniref:Uncharacterized protein n=1 Tax=Blattamonas nauphoetae TaxID=2049346 RepID=A0ABQ9YGJ2_9EUKA|nr:hypothetical protein BLNAU_2285 [Blattamonas nauphoetae]
MEIQCQTKVHNRDGSGYSSILSQDKPSYQNFVLFPSHPTLRVSSADFPFRVQVHQMNQCVNKFSDCESSIELRSLLSNLLKYQQTLSSNDVIGLRAAIASAIPYYH